MPETSNHSHPGGHTPCEVCELYLTKLAIDPDAADRTWCEVCEQSLPKGRAARHLASKKHTRIAQMHGGAAVLNEEQPDESRQSDPQEYEMQQELQREYEERQREYEERQREYEAQQDESPPQDEAPQDEAPPQNELPQQQSPSKSTKALTAKGSKVLSQKQSKAAPQNSTKTLSRADKDSVSLTAMPRRSARQAAQKSPSQLPPQKLLPSQPSPRKTSPKPNAEASKIELPPDPNSPTKHWCNICKTSLNAARAASHLGTARHQKAEEKYIAAALRGTG